MIGTGTIDSKILRIPLMKMVYPKRFISVTTDSESGTIFKAEEDCLIIFSLKGEKLENLMGFILRQELYVGLTVNSTQLTTNIDYISKAECIIQKRISPNKYSGDVMFIGRCNNGNMFSYEGICRPVKKGDYIRVHTNGVPVEDIEVIIKGVRHGC